MRIESAPEVIAFKKAHNIVPLGYGVPGSSGSGRRAYGELNDVTVSEAMDYVLQIFPGMWIYQTCTEADGTRKDFLYFY